MQDFFKRVQSFTARGLWLGTLMPTPLHAFAHLIGVKLNSGKKGYAHYKKMRFGFFAQDMSAIREVLIDQEYSFIKPVLTFKDRPIIFDIGGNIGTFSLWILGENPKSRILSLEASPQTYKTLNETVQSAHLQGLNWKVIHGAAWKNNDTIAFANEGDSMGHKVKETGGTQVKGITLSELLEAYTGQIDLMKIDIEGAEEAFLNDSQDVKTALKRIDNLVIELHPDYCNTAPVEALLKESFTKIENQTDRISSKPLWLCSRS